jgi:hypothetical protein
MFRFKARKRRSSGQKAAKPTPTQRRSPAASSGTSEVCHLGGVETKLGPLDTSTDVTTQEDIVGLREHMPRGAADP